MGSCTVQMELKPLQSGPLAAALQVNDAAACSASANLTGTGTPMWEQETLPLPTGLTTVPALPTVFGVAGDGSHVYAAGGDSYYVRDATGTWTAYPINTPASRPPSPPLGVALATNSVYLASDFGVLHSTAPTAWTASTSRAAMQGSCDFRRATRGRGQQRRHRAAALRSPARPGRPTPRERLRRAARRSVGLERQRPVARRRRRDLVDGHDAVDARDVASRRQRQLDAADGAPRAATPASAACRRRWRAVGLRRAGDDGIRAHEPPISAVYTAASGWTG